MVCIHLGLEFHKCICKCCAFFGMYSHGHKCYCYFLCLIQYVEVKVKVQNVNFYLRVFTSKLGKQYE